MEIRAINAYYGECPLCGTSQTSLTISNVDVLCKGCKRLADDIFNVFKISAKDLRVSPTWCDDGFILTSVNKITAMHYATEQEFEMFLPAGIKKIRIA